MRWFGEHDSDDPAKMTREQIIGVRIGLRLATRLMDHRAAQVVGRSKAVRDKRDVMKSAADEIHAMRDLYDPRGAK